MTPNTFHHPHFINKRVAIALQPTKPPASYSCDPILAIFDPPTHHLLSPLHPAQESSLSLSLTPLLKQATAITRSTSDESGTCSCPPRSIAHLTSTRARLPTNQRQRCSPRPHQPASRPAPTCSAHAAHCNPSSPATSPASHRVRKSSAHHHRTLAAPSSSNPSPARNRRSLSRT